MHPDRLAELEEERRFLLRSLRDLDAERRAGDVDVADYETLRDGYTKRAADVLREIEAGRPRGASSPGEPEPRRWRRTMLVIAGVAAVAVLAGWWVARSSGERLAGQQITGADPRSATAAALAEARVQLGSDPLAALETYDRVLAEDPDHPEALTYHAWLLYTTGVQSGIEEVQAQATPDARAELQRAVAADPDYADPHCFLAIIAANADGDVATARTEADRCLALGPPAAARSLIEGFLASLDAAGDGGSTVPTTDST
jgi:tetratricopeptide (TPR) repeat protein